MACSILSKNEWNMFEAGFLDDDYTTCFVNLFGCIPMTGNPYVGRNDITPQCPLARHIFFHRAYRNQDYCLDTGTTYRWVRPGVLMKKVFVRCFLYVVYFAGTIVCNASDQRQKTAGKTEHTADALVISSRCLKKRQQLVAANTDSNKRIRTVQRYRNQIEEQPSLWKRERRRTYQRLREAITGIFVEERPCVYAQRRWRHTPRWQWSPTYS